MSLALIDYLDGTDPVKVAAGARTLDYNAFMAGQISREHYEKTMSKTDQELFEERNNYWAMEVR